MLVVGLFAAASDAEGALDNLAEADYDSATVSVVTADAALAARLTRGRGPYSGLAPAQFLQRLAALGLGAADSAACAQLLDSGGIAVSVDAPEGTEADAAEILSDEKAQRVLSLRDGGGTE